MVRPEDLEKLFGQNPAEWVRPQSKEEKETEETKRKAAEATSVPVMGLVGVRAGERLYAFYRREGSPVEREENDDCDGSAGR